MDVLDNVLDLHVGLIGAVAGLVGAAVVLVVGNVRDVRVVRRGLVGGGGEVRLY